MISLVGLVSFPSPPASLRDETRTSYLLQGVQSAWDSVGRRSRHRGAAGGGAGGAASASSPGFELQEARQPEGAEAMLVPRKGNDVSSVTVSKSSHLRS